jgi:hypothetical protein
MVKAGTQAANVRAYRQRKHLQGWVNLTVLIRREHLEALDRHRIRRNHASRHETLAEVLDQTFGGSCTPGCAPDYPAIET